MIRSVAKLPFRALKRVLSLMDGERNAPSPAPPMPKAPPPLAPKEEAAPATKAAAPPKKDAPKKDAPKKAAPKKAAPKKAAPKKAAPKKAAPKKAAPKKAAPKKAAPKKAAPKKAAPKKESEVTVDPQDTPNPNAMKFTLSVSVADTGSFSFTQEDTDIGHPIAAAVVALDGVENVFGVNDFLTVSKDPNVSWNDLIPMVVDAIKKHA